MRDYKGLLLAFGFPVDRAESLSRWVESEVRYEVLMAEVRLREELLADRLEVFGRLAREPGGDLN